MELGFEFIGISGGKEDELRTGSWPLKGPPNEEINERDCKVFCSDTLGNHYLLLARGGKCVAPMKDIEDLLSRAKEEFGYSHPMGCFTIPYIDGGDKRNASPNDV
ncbi:hypothetical protein SDJN03_02349, partial [Cucurbita argyrosperma subsp. sororia]